MFGDSIEPGLAAIIDSTTALSLDQSHVMFYSAQRVDIVIVFDSTGTALGNGPHDITLTNPNGDTVTLEHAFNISGLPSLPTVTVNPAFRLGATGAASAGKPGGRKTRAQQKRNRMVGINMGGRQGPIYPGRPQSAAAPAITAAAAATIAPQPPPGGAVASRVQDLSAAHAELGKKVDVQSQNITGLHQKMESMFEQLKNAIVEHGKALQETLEQHSKQQQEQLDEKIRQFTQQKQGK